MNASTKTPDLIYFEAVCECGGALKGFKASSYNRTIWDHQQRDDQYKGGLHGPDPIRGSVKEIGRW